MNNNSTFIGKLRSSGLRPTKQRIEIFKLLFDRKDTFHFSVNDLVNILKNKSSEKISLATIYNTIHAFKNKGYLKEILLNSDKSYFDTNVSNPVTAPSKSKVPVPMVVDVSLTRSFNTKAIVLLR